MIKAIKQILKDNCIINEDTSSDKIVLKEANHTCVHFQKRGFTTLVIKLEKYGLNEAPNKVHPLIKIGLDLRKIPDYIMFCEKEEIGHCLVIELKSSNEGDGLKKLQAGVAISNYLLKMVKVEKAENKTTEDIRCVLCTLKENTNIKKKKKTKEDYLNLWDIHPEYKYQYRKIPYSKYQLDTFLNNN